MPDAGRAVNAMDMPRNDADPHPARANMLASISPVVGSAHKNDGEPEIRDAQNCHRAPSQISRREARHAAQQGPMKFPRSRNPGLERDYELQTGCRILGTWLHHLGGIASACIAVCWSSRCFGYAFFGCKSGR